MGGITEINSKHVLYSPYYRAARRIYAVWCNQDRRSPALSRDMLKGVQAALKYALVEAKGAAEFEKLNNEYLIIDRWIDEASREDRKTRRKGQHVREQW